MKKTQRKATEPIAPQDWIALISAPPGQFLIPVQSKGFEDPWDRAETILERIIVRYHERQREIAELMSGSSLSELSPPCEPPTASEPNSNAVKFEKDSRLAKDQACQPQAGNARNEILSRRLQIIMTDAKNNAAGEEAGV